MSTPFVFLYAEDTLPRSKVCRDCGRTFKYGEYVYEMEMRNNPWTDRWFSMHVHCLRNRTEHCPDDGDRAKQQFEELREKIAVTGNVFPD